MLSESGTLEQTRQVDVELEQGSKQQEQHVQRPRGKRVHRVTRAQTAGREVVRGGPECQLWAVGGPGA